MRCDSCSKVFHYCIGCKPNGFFEYGFCCHECKDDMREVLDILGEKPMVVKYAFNRGEK